MKILLAILLLCLSKAAISQDLAIKNALVYPSPQDKPITNALVLIKNGKISYVGRQGTKAIPRNTAVIDAKGMFMTAGYWNSHVHFTESKWQGADTISAKRLHAQLDDMTNSRGFTYVFDLAELDFQNLKALRARVEKGEVSGPYIRAVGVPLTPLNGSPFYIRPAKLPEVGDVVTAVKDVRAQIKSGAQGIKLFTGSSDGHAVILMKVAVARAAVKTAHRYGLPVFVHPSTNDGVSVAIASGADVLAHVAPDGHHNWTGSTINALIKKHIAVVPTLKMFQWSLLTNGADTTDNPLISTALQQIGSFSKAGGVVLFGTDVGYMTDYSTETEFELMSRAGLQFKDILKSLTTAPAKKFGLAERTGKIATGMNADIVLLRANPAADSRNFSAVAYTIAGGRVIYTNNRTR